MSVRLNIPHVHLLMLVFWALLSSGPARADDRLNTNPEATPFQTQLIKKLGLWSSLGPESSYCQADLDGDGIKELVEGLADRAIGIDGEDGQVKNQWQINLEPGWRFHSGIRLGAVGDLNGDGIDEIYSAITNPKTDQWRFVVLDAAQSKLVFSAPLPTGPDRRPDGHWDGMYHPYFLLKNADGRGRPGVVFMREVAYDARPRGLVVVDPFTGQVIWEWLCGPNPNYRSVREVDMGSRGQGIAFFGNSPDNLGGELVNGTSDDHAYVFLISSTGVLVWQHEVGPGFFAGGLEVADIGGDGQQEIIFFTHSGSSNVPNHMAIWDWSGDRMLAQTRSKASFDGVAVLAGPRPGTNWLVAGSNEGLVNRYLYENSTLVLDKSVLNEDKLVLVTGTVDLLDEVGPEIILSSDQNKRMFVLDRNLETLAVYQTQDIGSKCFPVTWQLEQGRKVLVTGGVSGFWIFDFAHRPLAWGPLLGRVAMVLSGLGLLLGVYFWGRKMGSDRAMLAATGETRVADREALYRLWLDLDDVKHEHMFEPSKGFRRLVWLLDAYTTDMGASPELAARIRKLMTDFRETDLPLLRGILSRAEAEGLANESIGRTTMVLASAMGKLETLEGDHLTVERAQRVQLELSGDLKQIEAGFLELWRTLGEFYTADPSGLIQGLLLIREVEFKRAGIVVKAPAAAGGQDYLCRIDTPALRYVLDNLLDNAVRAVRAAPHKEINISLERRDLEIVLGVCDTGQGIDQEDQERIFSGRFSSRGGGQGLFRSREILRRWRGEIELATSTPETGTMFILRLPVAVKNPSLVVRQARA